MLVDHSIFMLAQKAKKKKRLTITNV
jgi:hypothetical protein